MARITHGSDQSRTIGDYSRGISIAAAFFVVAAIPQFDTGSTFGNPALLAKQVPNLTLPQPSLEVHFDEQRNEALKRMTITVSPQSNTGSAYDYIAITPPNSSDSERDVWDILGDLIGSIKAPPDWAMEHDHYLYGTPKSNRE